MGERVDLQLSLVKYVGHFLKLEEYLLTISNTYKIEPYVLGYLCKQPIFVRPYLQLSLPSSSLNQLILLEYPQKKHSSKP